MDASKGSAPFDPEREESAMGLSAESPKGRTSRLLAAAIALLVSGLLAGCTTNPPQAVLNVPGNYVADLWATPQGLDATKATVVMCLDEASAVFLETGDGSEGFVGSIKLDWAGVTYEAAAGGDPVTMTTPVLQPGCGQLTFGVDCCHVDHYLAIKATKV